MAPRIVKQLQHNIPQFLPTVLGYVLCIALAIIAASLINSYVVRFYSVVGRSMESTLQAGDKLLINKLALTGASLTGDTFIPQRGQLIVFKNPFYQAGEEEKYIVKRVIGLPGDRVVVKDGTITVYNSEHTEGFNPDAGVDVQHPISGSVDRIVPPGELFVAGDNRVGQHSLDSRNGMSTVPVHEIEGTVFLRVLPLDAWRVF